MSSWGSGNVVCVLASGVVFVQFIHALIVVYVLLLDYYEEFFIIICGPRFNLHGSQIIMICTD